MALLFCDKMRSDVGKSVLHFNLVWMTTTKDVPTTNIFGKPHQKMKPTYDVTRRKKTDTNRLVQSQ